MKFSAVFHRPVSAFWNDQAHIIGLYSLAFGYPYITLLGNNPALLTAHEVTPAIIVITALVLALGIPAIIISCRYLLKRLIPKAISTCDLLFCIAMLMLANLYCSRSLIHSIFPTAWQLYAYWIASLAGTIVMTVLFAWKKTTDIFRIAAVLPLIFLVYLFFFSPASTLFNAPPATNTAPNRQTIANPVPIVIVIMDEFALSAILDRHGNIDGDRFPHLAEFAATSCWFRKARSVSAYTAIAVPVIATGRAVQIDPKAEAPRVQYADNIFNWLQNDYRHFNIKQWAPYLADPSLTNKGFRLHEFAADLAAFSYYFFFYSFAEMEINLRMPPQCKGFGYSEKPALETWLKNCRKGKSLNFIHLARPHIPLVNVPNGKTYENTDFPISPAISAKQARSSCLTSLSYHQYLLQCGYVDTVIGKIVEKLKKAGIFNDAVIVLTADHGACFDQTCSLRDSTTDIGLTEVGFIPMMIKRPHQTQAEISDRQATIMDIMPTISAILKTPPPWKMDGYDLFAPDFPSFDYDRNSKRIFYNLLFNPMRRYYRSCSLKTVTDVLSSRLEDKAIKFDAHTPLPEMTANYTGEKSLNRLLRRETKSFQILPLSKASASVHVSNSIFVTGNIGKIPEKFRGSPLAISLNGVISIITRPEVWNEYPNFFGAMFPQENATPASLEYYFISQERGQTILYKITNIRYRKSSLIKDIAADFPI